ncbi:phospho-sugar mutase [Bhargavaea massiliensis]|uniref:phospho-sugar mutase n=1 Tax=Bhargavaea massiliensis TaxID=2697500 RepID=UPI001BCE6B62|nr:phospho-sugar mutase [Bhargavaea massiliensis]
MLWREKYEQWLQQLPANDPLREQLSDIQQDERKLEDSFYKNLEFGTGGMRGILGPGTNRMNIYTVRKAAYGLGAFIESQGEGAKQCGVAIAYDSRHQSQEFALEVAKTLGAFGIRSFVYESLRPTPLLSFAVRHLSAVAGVMITASHNPPEYNGLKMYGDDGAQLPPEAADLIVGYMDQAESEITIETISEEGLNKLLTWIGNDVDQAYLEKLKMIQLNPEAAQSELSIVFTGLHGTGTLMAKKAFDTLGYRNVTYVEEQSIPDPEFTTAPSPNPEEPEAFRLAIETGKKVNADILLATDPDADRLGIAVRNQEGEYILLTGNQIGAILIEYILDQKQQKNMLPENGVIMKTIVTTEMARAIASRYGIDTIDTLTGFKFIAEKIQEFEKTNNKTFLFGYEESYGFLAGDFVRDKDAIQAAVLLAEAASHYTNEGLSLYEVLIEIFNTVGYHKETTRSLKLEGKDGAEQIRSILGSFRAEPPKTINGVNVLTIEDYQTGKKIDVRTSQQTMLVLPNSNVIKYILEDGSWICIRPSGTEPKIKFYYGVKAEDSAIAAERISALVETILERAAVKGA